MARTIHLSSLSIEYPMPHLRASTVQRLLLLAVLGLVGVAVPTSTLTTDDDYDDEDYRPATTPGELESSWIDADGEIYGARPNDTGPIGGRSGYARIVTGGDYIVSTADELIEALDEVQSGQTVYIDGEAEIDLSVYARIDEDFSLEIPEGVTLASNRGQQGAAGGMIFSDEFDTSPLIRTGGPNVRITGLRLRGPDPKQRMGIWRRSHRGENPGGSELYYSFPTSAGIRAGHAEIEVDNCELMGWSYAAVALRGSGDHHIHHNFIHHNQRQGLGYGVNLGRTTALIEYNLFDYNRHAIAASGQPGSGYEARHNVVLEHANGHLFDMHGSRDRGDTANVAGTWMKIHHNTFADPSNSAIRIRGVPEDEAEIHHNWFYNAQEPRRQPTGGWTPEAIVQVYVERWQNVSFYDNYYGSSAP